MTDQCAAAALVTTDRPERYAKQLAAHLGRRAEIRDEPEGTRIVLTRGECLLVPQEGVLRMEASAADEESLDNVMDVVGRHLERFGRRKELQVSWTRS